MKRPITQRRTHIPDWHWSTWIIGSMAVLTLAILAIATLLGFLAGQQQLSLQQKENTHLLLATDHHVAGDLELAAAEYERVLQINPDSQVAATSLEIILQQIEARIVIQNSRQGMDIPIATADVSIVPLEDMPQGEQATTIPISALSIDDSTALDKIDLDDIKSNDINLGDREILDPLDILWKEIQAAYDSGQWQDTIDDLLRIRAVDVDYESGQVDDLLFYSYVNLAAQKDTAGDLNEALGLVDKALEIRPEAAELHTARSQVAKYLNALAYERIEWAQAIPLLQELYERDPAYRDVRQRLIQAQIYYADALIADDEGCAAVSQYAGALKMGALSIIASKQAKAEILCRGLLTQEIEETSTPVTETSTADIIIIGTPTPDSLETEAPTSGAATEEVISVALDLSDEISVMSIETSTEIPMEMLTETPVLVRKTILTPEYYDTILTVIATPTEVPTEVPIVIPTQIPILTLTLTQIPSQTPLPTQISTLTQIPTPLPTFTQIPIPTLIPTQPPTLIPTLTLTETPIPTFTQVPIPTLIPTQPPTLIPTLTLTETPIPTSTPAPVQTRMLPPTYTSSPTSTWTAMWTATAQPTSTPIFTSTPTFVPTTIPTFTSTDIPTAVPTQTPTIVPTQPPIQVQLPTSTDVPPLEEPRIPDNGRILYAAISAHDGRSRIHSLPLDPSLPEQIVVDDGTQPNLRGDGQRLSYINTRGDLQGVNTIDPATGLRLRFTNFGEDRRPSWNGEGNRIAFESRRDVDRRSRIYVKWATQDSPAVLLNFGEQPVWNPVQDRIAFRGCDRTGNRCGLWTMSSSGESYSQLTAIPQDSHPTWSPSGEYAIFMSQARDGNYEVYRVTVGSGEVLRLTNDLAHDGIPAVSPDGNWVVFLSNRNGLWGFWVVPISGGTAQPVGTIKEMIGDWLEQHIQWIR